jgi:hypothetical protein
MEEERERRRMEITLKMPEREHHEQTNETLKER